jgi:phage/plasmid-associated DNA primase
MSCGYDYSDCIQEVNALLNSIFPNPENKQLILEILSGGLTGRAIEKFVLFNDGGRNGKGLLNDFVKITFGEYGLIYANVSLLNEKEKTGANPEKAALHNKLVGIMKEPDGSEPIRNDVAPLYLYIHTLTCACGSRPGSKFRVM